MQAPTSSDLGFLVHPTQKLENPRSRFALSLIPESRLVDHILDEWILRCQQKTVTFIFCSKKDCGAALVKVVRNVDVAKKFKNIRAVSAKSVAAGRTGFSDASQDRNFRCWVKELDLVAFFVIADL